MSKSLYNKYRSQTFDELVGQETVTKLLKNAIKKGKLSNAYLFVGSRGTGKTSTARILSKAINCLKMHEDGNPCNECKNCVAISSGTFLDLIEIDAASNRGIDQIRELKEKLEFSPNEGNYKIYIIDEVHMLTKEAFNALLKTLEEPPKHVVFILATTDVHKLPPTILSRCQRYDFKLGTDEQIERVVLRSAKAEGVKFSKEAISIIVNNAKGSYRDAMSLLDVVVSGQIMSDNPDEISESEVRAVLGMTSDDFVDRFLSSLLKGIPKDSLDLVYSVESDGVNLSQFTKQILERLRKALVTLMTGGRMEGDLSNLSLADINRLIIEFINLDKGIKYSSYPILSYELLIAQYAKEVGGGGSNLKSQPEVVVKQRDKSRIKEDDTIEEEEPSNAPDVEDESMVGKDGKDLGDVLIDFSVLKDKWVNIIQIIQSSNGPLAAILRSSQILNVENGVLNVQVPFQFYKDRIEEIKSREVINGAIKDLLGSGLKITCIVNGGVKKKRQSSADIVLASVQSPSKAPEENKSKPVEKVKVSKRVEAIFEGM